MGGWQNGGKQDILVTDRISAKVYSLRDRQPMTSLSFVLLLLCLHCPIQYYIQKKSAYPNPSRDIKPVQIHEKRLVVLAYNWAFVQYFEEICICANNKASATAVISRLRISNNGELKEI